MNEIGLGLLFTSAFVSSTLLPGGSEALFVALLWQGEYAPLPLLLTATAGNALGGLTSLGVGALIARRYPAQALTRPAHRQAVERVRRFGAPVLLLSWLPVVGDPLCVAAGWLRLPWTAAFMFIALGKGLRYAALIPTAGI